MKRRDFLSFALGGIALPAILRSANAQSYPSRTVRIIVGTAAGGGMDIAARVIAEALSEKFHVQFFVENRPGAGTNLGTEMVIHSPPDGYTLFLASAANAINATFYKNLSFDFIRDTTPVATIARVPQVMEIHPSVPAATLPEFIAYAKANPHKINMASAGNGSVQHIAGELFNMMAGTDLVHVPYKGAGPAVVDLLSGQMQVMFDTTPGSINYIKSGQLRPLGVTTTAPIEVLPNVKAIADIVPGYEASQWYGLVASKGTPTEIVAQLNHAVNTALSDPATKTRLAGFGGTPLALSPDQFSTLIVNDTEKLGKVVKYSGATID